MELLNYYYNRKKFDSISVTNVMREHLTNFINSRTEQDLRFNISENVYVISPIGTGEGHEAYRQVLRTLKEQVPNATFSLVRARYANDRISFVWNAFGPTANINEGYCTSIFQDGKVVQFTIDYQVLPQVNQQG